MFDDAANGALDDAIGGMLRPVCHATPVRNWMNDPNGLVLVDDTYHVFFQHNPEANEWGNMSWGHLASPDLVNWSEHPVAIPHRPDEMVFSGSVVSDIDNTSGLGDAERGCGPLVAVYTSVTPDGRQAQALAYSDDGGYTWTRYAANPVLDRQSNDFRDPKVTRFRGRDASCWLMVVVEAVDRAVLFYRSDNLRDWEYLSSFSTPDVDVVEGQVWECPDLVRVPSSDGGDGRWVLIVSVHPGGPTEGSGTLYFVGDFDGETFIPDERPQDERSQRWVDHGCDYYAATSFSGIEDGRALTLAWMNNWRYAPDLPTHPWRGSLTLPRELSVASADDGTGRSSSVLCQQVAAEVGRTFSRRVDLVEAPFRLDAVRRFDMPAPARIQISIDPGDADRIEVEWFDGVDDAARPLATLCYTPGDQMLRLQRHPVGAAEAIEGFAATASAQLRGVDGPLELIVWVDTTSIEVQTADGTAWLTMLVLPAGRLQRCGIGAAGGNATLLALELAGIETDAPSAPRGTDD